MSVQHPLPTANQLQSHSNTASNQAIPIIDLFQQGPIHHGFALRWNAPDFLGQPGYFNLCAIDVHSDWLLDIALLQLSTDALGRTVCARLASYNTSEPQPANTEWVVDIPENAKLIFGQTAEGFATVTIELPEAQNRED